MLLTGALFRVASFRSQQAENAEKIAALAATTPTEIGAKVNYLISTLAQGAWVRFAFYLVLFVFASLIIAIACGAWAGFSTETYPPSFVLLTRKSNELKQRTLTKNRRYIWSFIAALVTGIISSVLASYIFAALTT